MKTPLRVMENIPSSSPLRRTFRVEGGDGKICAIFGWELFESQMQEAEAIVAAVNGQAVQEERIRGLLAALRRCLYIEHRYCLGSGTQIVEELEVLTSAMQCKVHCCEDIAAAIRAAGGE